MHGVGEKHVTDQNMSDQGKDNVEQRTKNKLTTIYVRRELLKSRANYTYNIL